MTKLRFILLLIFFLPFMQYCMEKKSINKMSIEYLLNQPQATTRKAPIKQAHTYFSGEENFLIQEFTDLFIHGKKYRCTLCTDPHELSSNGFRKHFFQWYLKPFQCSLCNEILDIGYNAASTFGCKNNNGKDHCPIIRDNWIGDLQRLKLTELYRRDSTNNFNS